MGRTTRIYHKVSRDLKLKSMLVQKKAGGRRVLKIDSADDKDDDDNEDVVQRFIKKEVPLGHTTPIMSTSTPL
jgi:hypothetical protein